MTEGEGWCKSKFFPRSTPLLVGYLVFLTLPNSHDAGGEGGGLVMEIFDLRRLTPLADDSFRDLSRISGQGLGLIHRVIHWLYIGAGARGSAWGHSSEG